MEIIELQTKETSFISILSESFEVLFKNFGKILFIFTPLLAITALTGNIITGIIFSIVNLLLTNFTSIALMKYLQTKRDTGEELKLSSLFEDAKENFFKYTKISIYNLVQTAIAFTLILIMTAALVMATKFVVTAFTALSVVTFVATAVVAYYAFVTGFKIYMKIAFLYQVVADKNYEKASDYFKESDKFCENHDQAVKYAIWGLCLMVPALIITSIALIPVMAGFTLLLLVGFLTPVLALINLIFGSYAMIFFQNIYNRCKV